ncbi:MAG: hydrogenase-1 expression HyaE [Tepidamorphaceae bacterium]|nr:hydrogenase-1 expression HyaE [Rhodobiaceae bacterium]
MQPQQFSPLLQSIVEKHGYTVVDEESLAAFAAANEHVVLFFAGDAERLGESNDVAVILPELHAVFRDVLVPAVVSREAERGLQRRYRFNAFPALVFLRDGQYLGTIQRVLDWGDYLREIPEILGRTPSEPPPFKLPDGCVSAGATQIH